MAGFDPTNGIITQTSHVRVAVGRSWREVTPTSWTIYVGGAGETLEVDVRVLPADAAVGAPPETTRAATRTRIAALLLPARGGPADRARAREPGYCTDSTK